jgi:hypothetical protein
MPVKTFAVIKQLNTTYNRLVGAIQRGKISPLPLKDESGEFVWTPADIERARQALSTDLRRRGAVPAAKAWKTEPAGE